MEEKMKKFFKIWLAEVVVFNLLAFLVPVIAKSSSILGTSAFWIEWVVMMVAFLAQLALTNHFLKPEPEKELYQPTQIYEKVKMDCCKLVIKTQNFDKEIGIYCPICGGAKI